MVATIILQDLGVQHFGGENGYQLCLEQVMFYVTNQTLNSKNTIVLSGSAKF